VDNEIGRLAAVVLGAIESLPEEEREVSELVGIQRLTQAEAAGVIGASEKTVQRRLNRARLLLAEQLADLRLAHWANPRRPATLIPLEDNRRWPATPGARTARGDAGLGQNAGRCMSRLP
jgi:hypothetical protein